MTLYFIADHDINDCPGGAERVDHTIYSQLSECTLIRLSDNIDFTIDPKSFYIISNSTLLSESQKNKFSQFKNYIIFEHDYKFHATRQPNLFENCIIPKNQLINLAYYKNARIVFLQSLDHLECFKANGIEGNFYNLAYSIWNSKEIKYLRTYSSMSKRTYKACIVKSNNHIKGMDIAEAFCSQYKIDYEIISNLDLERFYEKLAEYPMLINTPRVKESFCRLVVEARCLNMNVLALRPYGAMREEWFTKSGTELIDLLEDKSKYNLELIKKYIT